jgi:hypothetical protein
MLGDRKKLTKPQEIQGAQRLSRHWHARQALVAVCLVIAVGFAAYLAESYTQGKPLIFYPFDLDRQPGIVNANMF